MHDVVKKSEIVKIGKIKVAYQCMIARDSMQKVVAYMEEWAKESGLTKAVVKPQLLKWHRYTENGFVSAGLKACAAGFILPENFDPEPGKVQIKIFPPGNYLRVLIPYTEDENEIQRHEEVLSKILKDHKYTKDDLKAGVCMFEFDHTIEADGVPCRYMYMRILEDRDV